MKPRFIGLCGAALLSLFAVAEANDLDRLTTLSFADRNSQNIQKIVTNAETCSGLLRAAFAAHAARVRTSGAEEIAGVRVIGSCQTVSLNHDGKLQVVSTADLENGNGPLTYVAVFKRSGLLDEADIPVGEGNGALGPIKLLLVDIHHDGRLELVESSRVMTVDGHIVANADPAPTVTHIYRWRNNSFILADTEFRDYFTSTVLPTLYRQLLEAQSSASNSESRQKKIYALQTSITLATGFLSKGHY